LAGDWLLNARLQWAGLQLARRQGAGLNLSGLKIGRLNLAELLLLHAPLQIARLNVLQLAPDLTRSGLLGGGDDRPKDDEQHRRQGGERHDARRHETNSRRGDFHARGREMRAGF
jgi:hypothetical protein